MHTQKIDERVDLTGKTAIVAGGATRIGQAVAIALAEYGAAVMIADDNLEAAYETVDLIAAKDGIAQAFHVDFTNSQDAEKLTDATVKCFGSVDILVNTATAFSTFPSLPDVTSLWNGTSKSSVKGMWAYCRAAAEEMMEGGRGGQIVTILSPEVLQSNPGFASGITVLSKTLANELAPHGITLNLIATSLVFTPRTLMQPANEMQAARGGNENLSREITSPPVQPAATADDLATVVLFLVSPAGKQVTGNLVTVG